MSKPPPFVTTDRMSTVVDFERRHSSPEGGALLLAALSAVEALHYLSDLDAEYELTRDVPGKHGADVVDVAHARWAAGTCITALDLSAAALARAVGGYTETIELDLGKLTSNKPTKAVSSVLRLMPAIAVDWIRAVLAETAFVQMKEARNALTHRRVSRRLYASMGGSGHDQRLDLQILGHPIPVRRIVEDAHDLANRHIDSLLLLLPRL